MKRLMLFVVLAVWRCSLGSARAAFERKGSHSRPATTHSGSRDRLHRRRTSDVAASQRHHVTDNVSVYVRQPQAASLKSARSPGGGTAPFRRVRGTKR